VLSAPTNSGRTFAGKAPAGATVAVAATGVPGGTATAEGTGTFTFGTAPAAGAAPVGSGTPQVGQKLTAWQGSWSDRPTSYAYGWKAAGAALSGAMTSSYVPVSSDVGKTLTVEVTASDPAGSSVAPSAATSAVTAASGPAPVAGMYNWKVAQFSGAKAGLARVANNTGRATSLHIGMSTTRGEGGGDGNTRHDNAYVNSTPAQFGARLAQLGWATNVEDMMAYSSLNILGTTYKAGSRTEQGSSAAARLTRRAALR
jgi:hypothetical protein